MKITGSLLALAALLPGGPAETTSPGARTLADAIALAWRTNPSVQGGRYDVRAAAERVEQARAALRPTLDLDLDGQYLRSVAGRSRRLANPLGPRIETTDTARAQLTAVQPIFTGGAATARRVTAEADAAVAREGLRRLEGDLLLDVISAYVDVRRQQAALAVWRTSVEELIRLAQEIAAREEAGEVTRTDIAQAERQIALAREQAAATEEALEAARADFAALVGVAAVDLAPEPDLPDVPRDVNAAYTLAEQLSPELAQARFAELGSRGDITAAKAQGLPTIGLRGTASLSGPALPYRVDDQNRDFAGTVVIRMPLSAGGRIASEIREARLRNAGDRLRIDQSRRELLRDVNQIWNQVVTSARAATFLDEQRRAAAIQLEGSVAEYRVGLRSTFDILFAQQALRDAEVALLAAQRNRYVAEATLLRRTGLLEARTIMTGIAQDDGGARRAGVLRDMALPWTGLIRALDQAGAPAARPRGVRVPPVAARPPALDPALPRIDADAPLARSQPAPQPPRAGGKRR